MSFGFFNTPTTFKGYFKKILFKKLDIFVIINLDNILNYIKDPDQSHIKAFGWVFENCKKHSLFSNLKKCWFHQDKVCFLDYIISA